MNQITQTDLRKLPHNKQILFACYCAEQVLHLVEEKNKEVCKKAIETAYLFLEGKATAEDCRVAAVANAVAANAAAYAARAADDAARATYVLAASSKEEVIRAQWDFYDQLLNGDKYFEEIVLGEGNG